jgi:hypothetical protein
VLGIVHRDLKPANLFCIRRSDGQPSIKVLDFGISKITTPGAPGHDLTHTTALMGSPLYMSPEQMQASKGVDVRTDIWALGVILFELIAGSPPFTAEAVTELAIKVANEPAPAVRSVRFDAPEGVERVIAKCLEKHRAARFQNVGELALALRDFGSRSAQISVERILGTLRQAGATPPSADDSQQVIVVARGSSPAIAATGPTEASWGQTAAEPTPKPGGRARLGFAIAAVVAILAAGGVLALRRPAPPSAAASVAPTALPPPVLPASPSSSALPAAPPPPAPAASSAVAAAQPTAPSAKPAASPARPASTTSAGPPSHKPNCNPPYVIDSAGDRQYKPECL